MPTHKYLEAPSRDSLKNNLIKLLEFHNIHYSIPEINSYSRKELKFLNHKFKIKLNNIDNPRNTFYRTSIFN